MSTPLLFPSRFNIICLAAWPQAGGCCAPRHSNNLLRKSHVQQQCTLFLSACMHSCGGERIMSVREGACIESNVRHAFLATQLCKASVCASLATPSPHSCICSRVILRFL